MRPTKSKGSRKIMRELIIKSCSYCNPSPPEILEIIKIIQINMKILKIQVLIMSNCKVKFKASHLKFSNLHRELPKMFN